MKTSFLWRVLFLTGAALTFAIVWRLDRARPMSINVSRSALTHLKPATLRDLAKLQEDVVITYYVSDPRRMPSDLRRLPSDVEGILTQMRRRSRGRLSYKLVDPSDDPELCTQLGFKRMAPYGVKSIRQDEFSVNRIWSSILIQCGKPAREKVIPLVLREHLPSLEAKIMSEIHEIKSPKPLTIALSFEQPDRGLREMMGSGSHVINFRFGKEPIPASADEVFLIQPRFTPERARAVDSFLEDGKSVFIFASPCHLFYEGSRSEPFVTIRREDLALKEFLDPLGVTIPDELALDVDHLGSNPSAPIVPPFGSDMQRFKSKIVGAVVAPVASPILLDPDRMKAAGWAAEVFMHSTTMAWTRPPTQPADGRRTSGDRHAPEKRIAWESFSKPPAGPWERRGLNFAVMLTSQEPWKGHIFLFSSQYFFDDAALSISPANRSLLHNVLQSFTTEEYRPGIRLSAEKPPSVPPLSRRRRLLWRFLCAGLLPLIWFLALAIRRAAAPGAWDLGVHPRSLGKRLEPVVPLAILALVALWPPYRSPNLDWTRDRVHRLDPASQSLYRALAGKVTLRYIASPEAELSTAGKRLTRALRDRIRLFRRESGGRLEVREEQMSQEKSAEKGVREQLDKLGVAPFSLEVIEEDAYHRRPVYSALVLESGDRHETVSPIIPGTESRAEFLVDAALLRLFGQARPRLTLVAEQPRLTPAEALSDYAAWSQPIPQSSDVYSHVRELLQLYGYQVQALSPKDVPFLVKGLPVSVHPSTTTPADISQNVDIYAAMGRFGFGAKSVSPDEEQGIQSGLLVYLQPFTFDDRLKDELDRHLLAGKNILVAAQHFNMQERQYRTRGFKPVYWPQPAFSRINEWLDAYGIELRREVLLDRSQKQATLDTQVRWGVTKEARHQLVARPFMIHTSPDHYNQESTITRHLGDQIFLAGNRWMLLPKGLAEGLRFFPLITTSAHARAIDWQGGFLDEEQLAGGQELKGPQPLAAELSGNFPSFVHPGRRGKIPARMVLIGNSEMFRDEHLLDPEVRAADLLMNAVVDLSYGPELSRVHARGVEGPIGFGFLSPRAKALFRLQVLGLGPGFFVLVGAWRYARSRRPSFWNGLA